MSKGSVISVNGSIDSVAYFPNRKPETPSEDLSDTFCTLSEYRDGAIYAGHYAGNSEWERHPVGDEIVMVIDGEDNFSHAGG